MAALVSPCRGTLTNLICMCGRAQQDWTADYRLYSRDRVNPAGLFSTVLHEIETNLPATTPLVAAIDDTLVRKTGGKIDGVGWKRDPLGPAFQTNLVRGQRYGFIRFGSRVDVYLAPESTPRVAVGDKVAATSTILAELPTR